MEVIEQSAFVLHSRPYREHQQIVDLLTEHDGKVSAVVYSGKTNKSNKKGLLQPFSPLNVVLKGRSSLKNLSRIEASEKSYKLKGVHLYSGFYINELLVRLLGEFIACPALFHHYQLSLIALTNQQSIEPILRKFELDLLEELGFSLDFSPIFEYESDSFYYVVEQGFVPSFDELKLPKYNRLHLQAIAQQDLSQYAVLRCNKILMRQVFNNLLGGKPLNSRKLFIKK
ncbi:MAG: DNA repair protein RecO [Alteromonadaceae bacterium]|nr:DNA repair protein RecO [Alteromonadaceae bacterium]